MITSAIIEINLQDNYWLSSGLEMPINNQTWENWFKTWLESLNDYLPLAEAYELSLRFTDDDEIETFNAQYRHKNQPTDVLAFAALEADIPIIENEPIYLGDLIISIPTATRQANEQNHSLILELAWLSTHGLLHLLGWDHPTEESLLEMLTKQRELLSLINLS